MEDAELLGHAQSFVFEVPASRFKIVVALSDTARGESGSVPMWGIASTDDLRHAHFYLEDGTWHDSWYTAYSDCYPHTRDRAVEIAVKLCAARVHPMVSPR
jgi:hypothetical protein